MSRKKCSTGHIFTSVPIQTVVWHTHRQLEKWHRLITIVWTISEIHVSLTYFYFTSSNSRKKNKLNVACASWKKNKNKKTIWVFSLNLKAKNSTECFVQTPPQNIRQTNFSFFFTNVEWYRKNTRRHRPNCLCGCQPECTCIGKGLRMTGGFTTTLYQTVPNTEQTEPEVKTDRPLHFLQTPPDVKPSVLVMCGNRSTSEPLHCSASSSLTSCFWHWRVW